MLLWKLIFKGIKEPLRKINRIKTLAYFSEELIMDYVNTKCIQAICLWNHEITKTVQTINYNIKVFNITIKHKIKHLKFKIIINHKNRICISQKNKQINKYKM